MSLDNESPVPISNNEKRKSYNLLPRFYRSDANKKFLSSTIDQLIQPGTVKKVSGFVGRKDAKSVKNTDVFIDSSVAVRQDYQLEPSLVIEDRFGNVNFYKDYIDYINQISLLNGKVDNHERLNAQEFYSWNPHIDWDKFVNFQQYYWLPYGPDPISIAGQQLEIDSTFTVVLEDQGDVFAFLFTPDGLTRNPSITLFRGQTYRFDIDSVNHPFSIKTKRSLSFNNRYTNNSNIVSDNAVELGTVIFTVPFNAPDVLYYVSENDPNVGGEFLIKNINENTFLDVEKDIIGKKFYVLPNGIGLTNGMKLDFTGKTQPEVYQSGYWFVEGVGDAISLVKATDLEVIATYTQENNLLFDDDPFDQVPFSTETSIPKNKDYITIKRTSKDGNLWSKSNRWFHQDVVNLTAQIRESTPELDQAYRAVRPIIEFDNNLKLYNFGHVTKKPVDIIDNITQDVFSTIEGSLGYNIDGIDLVKGMRVLFTADPDRLVNGRIFEVDFIDITVSSRRVDFIALVPADSTGSVNVETDTIRCETAHGLINGDRVVYLSNGNIQLQGLTHRQIYYVKIVDDRSLQLFTDSSLANIVDILATGDSVHSFEIFEGLRRQIHLIESEDSMPNLYETVLVRQGKIENLKYNGSILVGNQGLTYWYNGSTWKLGQVKLESNQSPLFDVFDKNGYSFSDVDVYSGSSFKGTKLFSYQLGEGSADKELGFNLSYRNINNVGDIVFDFNLLQDDFFYKSGTTVLTKCLDVGYLKKIKDLNDYDFQNGWIKSKVKHIQPVVRIHKNHGLNGVFAGFPIDVYDEQLDLSDLKVKMYVNGNRIDPSLFEVVDGTVRKYVYTRFEIYETDIVTVKTFSRQPKNLNGYYEVPINFQNNPLNNNILSFTLGEVIDHVSSIVDNIENFSGVFPGQGNLRDIFDLSAYGTRFVQHSGPINFSLYGLGSKDFNIPKALMAAMDDYGKFKNSFLILSAEIGVETEPKQLVDIILNELNKNKPKTDPWFLSDMFAYTANVRFSYTVLDERIKNYPLKNSFNLESLSNKSVLVYLNNKQLIHGKEYRFLNDFFEILIDIQEDDLIDVYEYENTDGSFCPPTPTKLGLYPLYQPKKFIDNTFLEPTTVIQGHDGSITIGFNDYRDDLLLELELRIFNNIKIKYDKNIFNIANYIPGHNRKISYSKFEQEEILSQYFYRWTSLIQNDFTKQNNDLWDIANPFTYNYRSYSLADNTYCPAFWRGIYKWILDTDTPHTTPWECLGFSIEPDWWQAVYGPAPYTSNNLILWDDIRQGIIKEPLKSIKIDQSFAKPILSYGVPVNEYGELVDPILSGFVKGLINPTQQGFYAFGDHGPVETAWRRSGYYPFALLLTALTMNPASVIALAFDRSRVARNLVGQLVYSGTDLRIRLRDLILPSISTSEEKSFSSGLVNYVVNNFAIGVSNPIEKFYNELKSLTNKISYRIAGFTSKEKLRVILTSKSPSSSAGVFLPQENYKIFLNTSTPVKGLSYSGVLITKYADGFEVRGYLKTQPYFKCYLPIGSGKTINVGGISESFIVWSSDQRYHVGQIIFYNNIYYRVKVTHTSQTNFNEAFYTKLAKLPTIGGRDISISKEFDTRIEYSVAYGTKFYTIQEVIDFIIGYGKCLKNQGFVFDEYNVNLQNIENWETSAKEFAFWTTQNWKVGSVISLSPFANKLIYQTSNATVDSISDNFYGYNIFRVDGELLDNDFVNTYRDDQSFTLGIKPTSPYGIYGSVIKLVQKEHILLLDNISLFNDVIYDLEAGYKQDKIKVQGYITSNWNGSFNVPGFIYDQAIIKDWEPWTDYNLGDIVFYKDFYYSAKEFLPGTELLNLTDWNRLDSKPESKLLPNWDYKAEQFNDYYDLNTDNFDSEQQRLAQHLIGYQKRQYLENIINDDISQYKFYQGMILEKGTENVFNKLFDVLSSDNQESLTFNEEWAVRVGTYGNLFTYEEIEFNLNEDLIKLNPQPVEVTENIVNDPDFIFRIKSSDIAIKPISYNENIWPITSKQDYLRTPGHVRYGDVNKTINTLDDMLAVNIEGFKEGDYVWAGFLETSQLWTVYRLTSTDIRVEKVEYKSEILSITLTSLSNLTIGQIIGIDNVNSIKGFYKINAINGRTVKIKTKIDLWTDDLYPDSTETLIYVFNESRVGHIDDLNEYLPKYIKNNELVWVDNNGQNKKQVLTYQRAYTKKYVENLNLLQNNINFGKTLAVSKIGNISVIAYSNGINIYFKDTRDDTFIQQQVINTFYPDSATFANSVAISHDGEWIAFLETRSTNTNNVHFYIKDSILGTFQYNRTITKTASSFGSNIKFAYNNQTYSCIISSDTNIYVYNFYNNISDWQEDQVLTAYNNSIDVDDSATTIVAANKNANEIKIYYKQNQVFSLLQTITGTDLLGHSLVISGDGLTIASGMISYDVPIVDAGKVRVYKKVNNQFVLQQDIQSRNPGSFDYFGYSLAFMNNNKTLVILSINGDVDNFISFDSEQTVFDNGTLKFNDKVINSGRVDVFDRYNENYIFGESLTTDKDTDINDGYGYALGVGADSILVSAIYEDSIFVNTGKVFLYTKNPGITSWRYKYLQEDKVDFKKFKKAYLYDTQTSKLLTYVDILDVQQGKIPGPADQEIKFKTFYDPAIYSLGNEKVIVDEGQAWNKNYSGMLWWDLSTAKFLDNSLGNTIYRSSSFNKLFQGASVDIYEWVETRYKPSEWDALSNTERGDSLGISGLSKYGNDCYSIRKVYDNVSQTFKNTYYYWVKNPTIIPGNITDRKLSANNVSLLISDPIAYNYPCISFIGSNSFILNNLIQYIKGKSTNLNIEFYTVDDQYTKSNTHSQWKLISLNEKTIIPRDIEQKWIDSLIGSDNLNRQVPSLKLSNKKRYGISNRPRQGMFVNRIEALKQFIEKVNSILKDKIIIDDYDISDLNLKEELPTAESGLWDRSVDIIEEQKFINTTLLSPASLSPIIVDGKIIEVKVVNSGYGYVNAPFVKVIGKGKDARLRCKLDELGQVIGVEILNPGINYTADTLLRVRNFTLLVKSDSSTFDIWSLYEFTNNNFIRIKSQSFGVTRYWDYIDWYSNGYNQFTKINFLVENTYGLFKLNSNIGDIVKVENVGSGGWLLLEKINSIVSIDYTNNYKVVGRQNGTIKFNSGLYDFTQNIVGFDGNLFDSFYYDNLPIKELRIIINVLKNNILVDDLYVEYLGLFFSSLRYILYEQPFVDWILKTSFVKSKHNLGDLKQKISYKNDSLEDFENYINEVKPYRTKIREFVSAYSNLDNTRTSVTDFDLFTYVDDKLALQTINFSSQDDSSQHPILNSYPWKFVKDNLGCYITEIKIVDGGSGYLFNPIVRIKGSARRPARAKAFISAGRVNRIQIIDNGSGYLTAPEIELDGGLAENGIAGRVVAVLDSEVIRSNKISMKFDRTSKTNFFGNGSLDIEESFYGTGSLVQFVLKYAPVTSNDSYTVTLNGLDLLKEDYSLSVKTSSLRGFTSYYGILTLENAPERGSLITVNYKISFLHLNALDRVYHYYNPGSGMIGKDFSQLMTGIDYGGVDIQGLVNFVGTGGWDDKGWGNALWGEENELYEGTLSPKQEDFDTQLSGGSFPFANVNGISPEDIIVDGDGLVTPITSYAPEEVVPGQVVDTVAIKVFQLSSSTNARILFKTYIGNGLATDFIISQSPQNTNALIVKLNDNIIDDYEYNWATRTVKLSSPLTTSDHLSIISIGYSSQNLLDQDFFVSDGSTTEFITNAPYFETNGVIVVVNGLAVDYDVFQTDSDYSVINRVGIRLGQAPDSGSIINYIVTRDQNSTTSIVKSQQLVGDGSTKVYSLNNAVGVNNPKDTNILVLVNGEILNPSLNEYFFLSGNQLTYRLSRINTVPYELELDKISVYLDGVKLLPSVNYNIDITGVSIVLKQSIYKEGSVLAVTNLVGQQYKLDNNAIEFTLAPENSADIEIITFYNHNILDVVRTRQANTYTTALDIDTPDYYRYRSLTGGKFKLFRTVNVDDFVWVIKNNKLLTPGIDYYLDASLEQVIMANSVSETDILDVIIFASQYEQNGYGFMEFKDILNRIHYKRLNKSKTTRLAAPLNQFDAIIEVMDSTVLDYPNLKENIPGIIEINGERIEYFEIIGNQLKRLRRGTLGTGVPVHHKEGTMIINLGATETIPYQDQQHIQKDTANLVRNNLNLDFIATQNSAEVFVGGLRLRKSTYDKFSKGNEYPYSPEGDDLNLPADFTISNDQISFAKAVPENVEVLLVTRTGKIWEDDQITSLEKSNNDLAKFIVAAQPFYPEHNK